MGDSIIAESSDVLASAGASVQIIEVNSTVGSVAVSIDARARTDCRSRVEDDLETLRSTASGQAMLTALNQRFHETESTEGRPSEYRRGHIVGITELDACDEIAHIRDTGRNDTTENGYANTGADWQRNPAQHNGRLGDSSRHAQLRPATGGSAVISYNQSVNLQLHTVRSTPPIVILFHEFAHSYNMATGTGVSDIYNGTRNRFRRNTKPRATGYRAYPGSRWAGFNAGSIGSESSAGPDRKRNTRRAGSTTKIVLSITPFNGRYGHEAT